MSENMDFTAVLSRMINDKYSVDLNAVVKNIQNYPELKAMVGN